MGWILRRTWLIREGCVDLRIPDTKFDNSYAGRFCESSFFCIDQSDNRNIDYLLSWLQKTSLEQLLFECSIFSEPLVFKDKYIFKRTSMLVS